MNEQEKKDESASEAGKELSRLGAKKGGQARAHVLTESERKEIAQRAVKARWEKYYSKYPEKQRKRTQTEAEQEQVRIEKLAREQQQIISTRQRLIGTTRTYTGQDVSAET